MSRRKSIVETTVGNIHGVTVAVSGIYKGGDPRERVVNLTLNGQDQLRAVARGQEISFAGEPWRVERIKKSWFRKGSIHFVLKE